MSLQTSKEQLAYMAFYGRVEDDYRFGKLVHYVLFMEYLLLLNSKEQGKGYKIDGLMVTEKGLSIKTIEYDFQHNKEELLKTIQLKNETLEEESVADLLNNLAAYIALFHTKKKGIQGLFKESMKTETYKKFKNDIDKGFKDIHSEELYRLDKEKIKNLIEYDMYYFTDLEIKEVEGKAVVVTEGEITKEVEDKAKEDIIKGVIVDEPYVYDTRNKQIKLDKELSGF